MLILWKRFIFFWGERLSQTINNDLKKEASNLVVNLTSQGYFEQLNHLKLRRIISPSFLDEKNGKYKIISFYAKKAEATWLIMW